MTNETCPVRRLQLLLHDPCRTDAAREAARLAAEPADSPAGLAVLLKTGPTPPGFPRRPGVAKKRPLA